MSKIMFGIVFIFCVAISPASAQERRDTTDSLLTKSYVDSIKKANADSLKKYKDLLRKSQPITEPEEIASSSNSLEVIVVVAFFIVMITLLILFFSHLARNRTHIGYQSIKLIGLILIFPGICILAIVGGKEVLAGQTLAVLLGTIAGYVLSRDDDKDAKSKDEIATKEKELKDKVKELEEKLKLIRERNPGLQE